MLLGYTGSEDKQLQARLERFVRHRGKVSPSSTVAGEFTEADDEIHLAWSGTLRSRPSSLITAYRRDGLNFLGALEGEFIIAICDGDVLHIARDHVGARTAYYGKVDDRWVVAVEPKAIWQQPNFQRRLRPGAVAQYLAYSFIPGHQTMLQDLYEVRAGEAVTVSSGKSEPVRQEYCRIQIDAIETISVDEAPGRFRKTLEVEIEQRLDSNESPVVFLSGGLDSSVVTAELARQSARPVRTFAIHFGKKYPNELDFARLVADRFGTDHIEVEISPRQAVSRMRQMVWFLDEPIGDPITAPNFELAAFASKYGVKEVFNGEGGDPLFGGPKNLPMMLSQWYGGVDHSSGARERRYLQSYRRCYEELNHCLTPKFREGIDEVRDLHAPLRPFFESTGPLLHKLLAINTRLKGAHLILPKVERMLGASGLQPVSPLFSKAMLELAFATSPKAKLQSGCEKWLIKRAYEDVLPREIIQRPKSGMRVPVHYWFKGPLKRFARKLLSSDGLASRGIFNPERIRQWQKYDLEKSHGRYGLRLWMLLTFELWYQMVFSENDVGDLTAEV